MLLSSRLSPVPPAHPLSLGFLPPPGADARFLQGMNHLNFPVLLNSAANPSQCARCRFKEQEQEGGCRREGLSGEDWEGGTGGRVL